jgi:hypothetical protein
MIDLDYTLVYFYLLNSTFKLSVITEGNFQETANA